MKILTVPNPILKKKSCPVKSIDKNLARFIQNLETTLKNKKNPEGVGLSAPQVGKNIRVFVTFLDHGDGDKKIRTYINPTISKFSTNFTLGPDPKKPLLEGCLSIPKLWGPVHRHMWIKLDYYTLANNHNRAISHQTPKLTKQAKRFKSFPARVIQHELDHLDGILFTTRALKQGLPLFQEQHGKLVQINI